MDCFICGGSSNPAAGQGIYIESASSKFTGDDITSAINHLVGDAFSVVIDANDTLCCNCASLIGELDRFRYESIVLEEILQRQINRKYKLGDFSKVLLSIDSIALLSFNVKPNGQNECKECGQVVQHLDEIAAHYKYHELCLEKLASIKVGPKIDVFKEEDSVYLKCNDLKDESNSVCNSKFELDEEYDFQEHTSIIIEEEQSNLSLEEVFTNDVIVLNQEDCLEEIPSVPTPLSAKNEEFVVAKPVANRAIRPFKFKCTKCSYITKLRKCLQSHYVHKHGQMQNSVEKKFTCEKCNANFEHIFQIENHIKDNHLQCRVCQLKFDSSRELRSHIKEVHNKYQFECKYCGKFWRSCSNRDTHEIAAHTRKYRHHCSYCGKGFSVACTMRLHIAAKHTNEPNHICDLCGRMFIYKYDYKIHKMLHATSKPFKCKLCDETFRTPSMRGKHTRQVHTKIPLHTCEYCGIEFFQKGRYQLHLISKHTHEFVHKCPMCSCRGFLRKRELARHLNMRHRDSSMLEAMDAAHDHRMANLKIVVTRSKKDEPILENDGDSCEDYE